MILNQIFVEFLNFRVLVRYAKIYFDSQIRKKKVIEIPKRFHTVGTGRLL